MDVFFTSIQVLGEGKDAPRRIAPMEAVFHAELAGAGYGGGVDQWFLIFVFQRDEPGAPRARERHLYRRSKGEIDLRLYVDHEAWRAARRAGDTAELDGLLFDVARRSCEIMRAKKIDDFDVDAFQRDVQAIGAAHGWAR